MPDLVFDFTWYRDQKGYRLIPAKVGKRGLDALIEPVHPARIVRNGGKLQSYRPLDNFPNLFRRFVDMAKSEDGVLKFVHTFGPLTHDGLRKNGDVAQAMIDEAQWMSKALRRGIVAMPLNQLNASIIADQTGMRLKVSPVCLLDAMWLQLAQSKSDPASFRECEQCHELFMAGVGARRADAKFCSDECRIKFNSHQRSRR